MGFETPPQKPDEKNEFSNEMEELKKHLDEKGISHNLGIEKERMERILAGLDWRLQGVNELTKMLNDLGSAILDVDPAYKEMDEKITKEADDFGKHFFEQARSNVAEERLKYVQGMKRLRGIVGEEKYRQILKNLLTNEETIEELARKGKAEISAIKKYEKNSKSIWTRFRKK